MIKRIVAFTRDKSMFSKDTLLNAKFRITTNSRILPEPAPPTAEGDFGVRLTGDPGPWPKQIDIDQVFAGYEKALEMGMLSREQVARLKADLLRTHGGGAVITNAVGVTRKDDTVKWSSPDGGTVEEISALNQSDVDDLERLFGGGALTQDQLYSIRAANRGQPKRSRTGMASIDRALRSAGDIAVRTRIGENFNKAASDFWGKRA